MGTGVMYASFDVDYVPTTFNGTTPGTSWQYEYFTINNSRPASPGDISDRIFAAFNGYRVIIPNLALADQYFILYALTQELSATINLRLDRVRNGYYIQNISFSLIFFDSSQAI